MKTLLLVGFLALGAAVLAAASLPAPCPAAPPELRPRVAAEREALAEHPGERPRQAALGIDLIRLSGALEHSHPLEAYRDASEGRDLLEGVLAADAGNLDARETLYCLYARAPWPLGSRRRAAAQLAALRARDPARAQAAPPGWPRRTRRAARGAQPRRRS